MNTGSYIDKSRNHHELALAADREGNQLVGSLRRAWRSEFPGPALNPERWEVISQGAGQSISFLNGELTINTGTTPDEAFVMRTIGTVSIPFRAWFIGRLSQRIANQEIRFEAINAAGDMVAGWLIDGVTATTAKYYSANSGNLGVSAASTVLTTAANSIFELEMFPDEFWAVSRAVDSVAVRTNPYCKTLNIPDPEEEYFLQVRVTNLATAPASNTQVIIGAVAVQDINELTVEVTGGRGDSAGAKAVAIAGAVTATVAGTSLAGSATQASSTSHNKVSLASTNATLVKASAGSIYWMFLANTSASWRYVKFFNSGSAPVPGTNTPTYTIAIPPNDTVAVANAVGMRFATGIGYSITALAADLDTTAVAAGDVVMAFNYT